MSSLREAIRESTFEDALRRWPWPTFPDTVCDHRVRRMGGLAEHKVGPPDVAVGVGERLRIVVSTDVEQPSCCDRRS
jgi:hypothetical protein